ncbi:MAG: hypothetical protein N2445_02930 [Acidobacteria bacterium]|nr:hypothetical protein [Acidobacteriota bacterium]
MKYKLMTHIRKPQLPKAFFCAFILVVCLVIFQTTSLGSDVAIVVNSNFPELKSAADQAMFLLKSNNGFSKESSVFELSGTSRDSKILSDLKASNPKIVLAIGVYSAKMARKVLPETPIIYLFIRYPETEGFAQDPKMVGISVSGTETALAKLISSFAQGRADFASAKKIAVMYSDSLEPSIKPVIENLKQAGLNPQPYPLSEVPLLELIMQDISSQYQTLLLFPDKTTQNDYSLRFIITRCLEKRVLTFALDYSLVERGVFAAVYAKPEECINLAIIAIKNYFLTGKLPEKSLLSPPKTYTVVNKAVLKYINLNLNFEPDSTID